MKKFIVALILGLILAQPALAQGGPASAQALSSESKLVELMTRLLSIQAQIIARLQERYPAPAPVPTPTPPVRPPVAAVYPVTAPIRLNYLQGLRTEERNQSQAGEMVTAYGSGFTSTMKVIIHGQAANEQAYTYVLTTYPVSATALSFLFPLDAPDGILDVYLADGTTRISRVSNTLLIKVGDAELEVCEPGDRYNYRTGKRCD